MPRSGTTWLARLLASGLRTALPGREPMNPRGRQYALSGTLPGWVRLTQPTVQQVRILRRAYAGINPWTYSRYGHRQWIAGLPNIRCIVKDPFAMLSIPAIQRVTGARAVLVYRHPGAALASYRRMGWTPDTEELVPIISQFIAKYGPTDGVVLPRDGQDDVSALAWFWSALYGMALRDTSPEAVDVVSHRDVAIGGDAAARRLFQALELTWTSATQQLIHPSGVRAANEQALHNLHRDPAVVADAWRDHFASRDVQRLDEETAAVREALEQRSLRVSERPAP
ncbi:sulfotransferase [Ornithinimicrobium faecis]|uniref:Sulfotransferase n=2 Tax=Ornithinimicrobium faecis TaxID=2934158 RepID=A0ABY4YV70_9MICO|nr:sulfotransferase [Ornithinimicrobium sp. HY1793]